MNKEKLIRFVEKYYLTGINEAAILKVEDEKLTTLFKTPEGDLRGLIEIEDIKLPDAEIGFYSTGTFLKMISILEDKVDIELKKKQETNTIVNLTIKDEKNRKITYATCDLDIIDSDGKKGVLKSYDVKVPLYNETISNILKANAAIPSKAITFLVKDEVFYIVFNYSENNSDKIEIELPAEDLNEEFSMMSFSSQHIKSILEVNSKKFSEAFLEISMKGILRIYFKDIDSTAEYWMVKMQD